MSKYSHKYNPVLQKLRRFNEYLGFAFVVSLPVGLFWADMAWFSMAAIPVMILSALATILVESALDAELDSRLPDIPGEDKTT